MKEKWEQMKSYAIFIAAGILVTVFLIWKGPWSREIGTAADNRTLSIPGDKVTRAAEPRPLPLEYAIARDPVLRTARTEVARNFRSELARAVTLDETRTTKVIGKVAVELERGLARDLQRARLEERLDEYFRQGGQDSEYYQEEWFRLKSRHVKETMEVLKTYVDDAELRLEAGEDPTELRAIVREARRRFESTTEDAAWLATTLRIIRNLVRQQRGGGKLPAQEKTGSEESIQGMNGEMFVSTVAAANGQERREPPKAAWSGHAARLLQKWK